MDAENKPEEKKEETKKPEAKKAPVKKAAPKPAAKKPAPKATPAKKKAEEEFAYGVDYVAKALGKDANLVRVSLRKNKVKKAGKSYGWKTKAEADSVVKKLKAA